MDTRAFRTAVAVACALVASLVVSSALSALTQPERSGRANLPLQSECVGAITNTLSASSIRTCDTTTVTVGADLACPDL